MTATAADTVGLDRVMLAMDVVDTLRHQQALVDAELDDDQRQREFVARVQAIYESQGIEVPAAVIEEGTRALREKRFVYTRPERTFAVRLAEIYVARGRWAKRLLILALAAALVYAAFAVPGHFRRRGLIEAFEQRTAQLAAAGRAATTLGDRLLVQWERAHNEDDSPAASRLLVDAETALQQAGKLAASIAAGLQALPPADAYPEQRADCDAGIAAADRDLAAANSSLGMARGLLDAVAQLRTLQVRHAAMQKRLVDLELSAAERQDIAAADARVAAAIAAGDGKAGEAALRALDASIDAALQGRQRQAETRALFASLSTALGGVDVEPAAAAELAQLRTSVEQAMAAGDWSLAGQQVSKLRDLVQLLDQSYELRIVSRPGDQSGVWRHRDGNQNQRNYYIVVEAIGPNGKALSLPITSEEDQSTRTVRRFAIRVPEEVYGQVRADKLDNGLIDRPTFGRKRRGAREPQYDYPTAGGRITEW